MSSISDDKGYNQGFTLNESTIVRMQRRATWLVAELPHLSADATILEVGCGTGEVAYWMAQQTQAQIIATDTCEPFIHSAREKYVLPNLRFETVSVQALADAGITNLNAIVGNGILHHLEPELEAMLKVFHKLLKPGGQLVFMEPNYYNPYIFTIFTFAPLRKLAKLEPNEMAFSKHYIDNLLAKTGFAHYQVSYRDFLLPGVPIFLIKPLIVLGTVLEKIPLLRAWSQSLFITAKK